MAGAEASSVGHESTTAVAAMWFSKPHGVPSGVCTGHRKPHDSGSSLRTVVVFIVVKNCPRCTLRKCDRYRRKFSRSATIVKPLTCMRSSPVELITFPVLSMVATLVPTLDRHRSANLRIHRASAARIAASAPLPPSARTSFRSPCRKACKPSSSFSLTKAEMRCPGSRISRDDMASGLSFVQRPSTNA
eukprot:scaffold2177_cov272-Pinguiococcus_pyrenoidosus.AAC.4